MGKKAPAQPAPPDPVATAQAQSEFNIDAARTNASLNRVDQYTPQGSLTYRQRDDGPDRWQSFVTLSPEQQRLYDQSVEGQSLYGNAALSQLRGVQDTLSRPFQFGGPDVQYRPDFTGIGDPNQSREAVEAAVLSRVNPDLERERAALENRLANQGITMGSQAWNTGMQDWQRMANDARMQAVLTGGQEQSRVFGLGMGQAQMSNAARQQSLEQQLALRSQPLNEAAALLTGSQVQNPQFTNVPQVQVQAPDYAGSVAQNYAGQMSGWNANTQRIGQQNAAIANMIGQVAGAGTSYLTGGMRGGLGFGAR